MSKVYITGANGFVGKQLSNYLRLLNYSIVEVLRTPNNKDSINYQDYFGQSLESKSIVIHLAGKAHDLKNISDKHTYFDVNYELTKKVYDIFLQSEANVFFFMSSVKAVADTVQDILDENSIADPKTPYGQSKLQAEKYLLSQKLPEGKRLFIIRPCMIHGPGNKGNLNLLYNVVRKGIPYPLGSFNNERSFLSIDNLNYIIKSILDDKNIPSGIYNVADDDFVSTNKLIAIIAKVQNRNPKIWNVSKRFVFFMAKVGDVLRLPLNTERLQKLTEDYRVSNKKIKSALGIEKMPFSAEEGLIKTIKSFSE